MSDAEILALELVCELSQVTPEEFQRYKLMFLADAREFPRVTAFLHTVFGVVESCRPKLLEMKGGATE